MSDALDQQVIALIAQRKNLPADQIAPEMTLADIGVNSLDAIELVFEFEDTFKISIPNEAVQQMRTVDDVIIALRAALASH